MLTKEQFIEQRQQGKTIDDLWNQDVKESKQFFGASKMADDFVSSVSTTQAESPEMMKEPSPLSKMTGVASRALEVPTSVLVALPAQTIRNVMNLVQSGNVEDFKNAEMELRNKMINIPGEVLQGWTEGFWKQSDILSPAEGLGLKKESLGGMGLNIAAEGLTPGGAIKLSAKGFGAIGKQIPQIGRAAKYVSGIPKPVFKAPPQLDDFSIALGKKTREIQSQLNNLIKVDFGQTTEELLKETTKVGKKISGKVVATTETLADKARAYKVPMDDWENAKRYIEVAKSNAGKMVEKASENVSKISWQPVVKEMVDFVNDVQRVKGFNKEIKSAQKVVQNINNELSKGTVEAAYKLRNSIEKIQEARQRLLQTGDKIMTLEDQILDIASQQLRTKLNEVEPLRAAQKAYVDLTELSKKAADKTAEVFAKKDKIGTQLKNTIESETKDMQKRFEVSMRKWKEGNEKMMQDYQNKLNSFSPQKFIGKVIEKAPSIIGGIIGAANRAIQPVKQKPKKEEEKK